jgi:hypothetical protein
MEPTSEPMPVETPKSNKTLIIVVVVVLVLCCCCAVTLGLGWTFGDAIIEALGM